jgi:hypothetical protein
MIVPLPTSQIFVGAGVGRKTLGKERFSNPFSILSLKKISSVSDAPWNVEFIDKILTFQQLFCII